MNKVHWLGAGLSAVPGIRRLAGSGHDLVLWNRTLDKAVQALCGLSSSAVARQLDWQHLATAVQPGDVVVSMLPATMHLQVAEICLQRQSHFVSSSYVSAEMLELSGAAAAAGLCFVNEVGLDPGIDHLFAHVLVSQYQSSMAFDPSNQHSFRSYCGGFPKIPNEFRYKFSWSPLGVLRALNSPAKWIAEGQTITTEQPWKMVRPYHARLPRGSEKFEAYPNRNSLSFLSEYGFQQDWQIREFIRGTLRLDGWSDAWQDIFAIVESADGESGQALLQEKSTDLWNQYQYQAGELDRVVLSVDLEVQRSNDTIWHQVYCLDECSNEKGTAMARLVSLPASFAVEAILQEKIRPGVSGAPQNLPLVEDWLSRLTQMGENMQRIEIV